jgi:hypothetical protein
LYTEGLSRIIAWAGETGFTRITSRHALHNTPVIIAKLRQGFQITGVAIDPEGGPCLDLAYFLAAEVKQAYLHRAGLNVFTPGMMAASMGTAETLYRRLQAARSHA